MTFNDWFMPHCLYALAKLEKLTYLSLQGCNQFKDCIPYASITAITGFKCLQVSNRLFISVPPYCVTIRVVISLNVLKPSYYIFY